MVTTSTQCSILVFFHALLNLLGSKIKLLELQGAPPALLDHVFSSNFSSKFAGILIDDLSDHLPVFLIDQLEIPKVNEAPTYRRDVSDENISSLCEKLTKHNWETILKNSDPQTSSEEFFGTLPKFSRVLFSSENLIKNPKGKKTLYPGTLVLLLKVQRGKDISI